MGCVWKLVHQLEAMEDIAGVPQSDQVSGLGGGIAAYINNPVGLQSNDLTQGFGRQLINSGPKTSHMLVLEDDAIFLADSQCIEKVLGQIHRERLEGVVMLGYHARNKPEASHEWDANHGGNLLTVESQIQVATMPKREFLGGTFAYVISRAQAAQFLDHLERHGFDQQDGTFAVDHFMREKTEVGSWYATSPRVAHSDFAYRRVVGNGRRIDSDVSIF